MSGLRKKRRLNESISSSDEITSKRVRPCERASCPASVPQCFAEVSEKCCGDGYTSRWYHISPGEHFCNECFDFCYRSNKEGHKEYSDWQTHWNNKCKYEPNIKTYMVDQHLEYWLQCSKISCGKWRQVHKYTQLPPQFIRTFVCCMSKNKDSCLIAEDSRVERASSVNWLRSLATLPPLQHSPAAIFLTDDKFYPDMCGMSPDYQSTGTSILKDYSQKINENLKPFCTNESENLALAIHPDVMDEDELIEFADLAKNQLTQIMYLALRNLVLATWALNCQEFVTMAKCMEGLVVRGLFRVRCVMELERIIHFLTQKGLINIGLLFNSPKSLIPSTYDQEYVIVVGAGIAGIAAARHLRNSGIKVLVLEAQDRLGGRIWDDQSLGPCLGRGAQNVLSVSNNPISLMSHQSGLDMKELKKNIYMVDIDGALVDKKQLKRAEFHFDSMLGVDDEDELRSDINDGQKEDVSIEEKLFKNHQIFMDGDNLRFSEQEERALPFYLANLELVIGDSSKVSLWSWEEQAEFTQFAGGNALLSSGYYAIANQLVQGISVKLNTCVVNVDYSHDNVVVRSSQGQQWTGSKVIITVPLSTLQKRKIKFKPPLPTKKLKAIHNLGVAHMAKVALKFTKRFWSQCLEGGAIHFGRIPRNPKERGMFPVFYDISLPTTAGLDGGARGGGRAAASFVLVTVITGQSLQVFNTLTDQQVIQKCVTELKSMFPQQEVPYPSDFIVTRWCEDQSHKMAFSYVPVGISSEAYDTMAEDVQEKLYFAGEATNRQMPASVVGAYLSGLREARKIITTSCNAKV